MHYHSDILLIQASSLRQVICKASLDEVKENIPIHWTFTRYTSSIPLVYSRFPLTVIWGHSSRAIPILAYRITLLTSCLINKNKRVDQNLPFHSCIVLVVYWTFFTLVQNWWGEICSNQAWTRTQAKWTRGAYCFAALLRQSRERSSTGTSRQDW